MRHGRARGRTPSILLTAGLVLTTVLGCLPPPEASRAPVPPPPWVSVRRVRVVAAPQGGDAAPQVGGRVGKAAGAGKGALTGAGGGALAGLDLTLRSGALAPILAPIFIPFGALAGAAGGAAVGYANAIPEAQARSLKDALERSRMDLCTELAHRVSRRLPDLGKTSPTQAESDDLQLEVAVEQWGMFGGTGSNPTGDLEATFSFRVLAPGNACVLSRRFVLGGERRSFSEWTAGGEKLQDQALGHLLDSAAEAILDEAFLTQEVHPARAWDPVLCGLKHLEPAPTLLPGVPLHLGSPKVPNLNPVLAWQAFEAPLEAAEGPEPRGAVTDIAYDLRIWRSIGGGQGELVYDRTALALASRPMPAEEGSPATGVRRVEHRVEATLLGDAEYLWAVRARYRVGGVVRATRWSMNQAQEFHARTGSDRWFGTTPRRFPCLDVGIPPLHHHRFRTP